LAYNPAENVWYAGGRTRTIYQLEDTNGDGSFLDESWVPIFTYPDYGGSHNDGLEYVGGYLWISDMTSDVIGKWQYNPSTDSWEELNRFTYTELADVEGMGFGPNDHFWCGSGWGSESYIYELGNEITKGYPIAEAGPDVDAHPPTIPVKFDASGSHHTDPAKEIVLYEWDFESDGIWDYRGTDLIVEHAYPAYYVLISDRAAELAKAVIGANYQWAAEGYCWKTEKFVDPDQIKTGYWYDPDKYGSGLDCSGLVFWSYNKAVGTEKYGDSIVPRVAHDQWKACTKIDKADLRSGDLLFFDVYADSATGKYTVIGQDDHIDHVAMYVDEYIYNGEIKGIMYSGTYNVVEASGTYDIIPENVDTLIARLQALAGEDAFVGFARVTDAPVPDGSIDWDKTAKDYTATLRVTDNSDPPLQDTDTCIVHITAPPWKPVANPNGPYEGYEKVPIQLDGSKSYDPESKMFPTDHPWYETIATYEWDLDYDGQFDDATGAKPTYTWDNEGLYIIGLKVTDSQPSGPDGTIGPLDVDIKYTTVVVKTAKVINVGIIPVDTGDCSITHSKSYFSEVGEKLRDYYFEVSYNTLLINYEVYEREGGDWISVSESTRYYAEDRNNRFDIRAEEFINAALDACENVDFTMFDYDEHNGKGVIVFVPAGYAGGAGDSDNFWAAFYYGAEGGYFVRESAKFDVIIVPEWTFDWRVQKHIGALAHEVGHALGELLITSVMGSCKDCAWPLPDLYRGSSVSRGDVDGWGLMGSGAWSTYVHMCSFSKEWLGWLKYEKIGGAYTHPIGSVTYEGLGDYWVNSITTMKFQDDIPIFEVKKWYECAADAYIIEARTSSSDYSKWDNAVPETGLVIYYYNKKCLPLTHDMVEFKRALTKKDESYSDPNFGIVFKFLDTRKTTENLEISYSIERYDGKKIKGSVMTPSAQLLYAISSILDRGAPRLTSVPLPDLDLHAYSVDGRHVGLNYETNEYEIGIEGTIASGDSFNGIEWIFVPEDVNVHFVINAKDNKEFFDMFPEAWEVSDGIETFNLSLVYYDSDGNRWESAPISEQIEPGETIWHIPTIIENPDGTYTIEISPITWEHVFEDPKRQTVLKISTDDKYFQFIAPDKKFLVKQDLNMKLLKRAIVICYEDWEIKIFAIAVDTQKLDFCVAIAWDEQTRAMYLLIDEVGIES